MTPSPIDLARDLTCIHHHAKDVYLINPEERVYKESELIALLQEYGHPAPDWDAWAKTVEEWEQRLREINLISHPGETLKACIEEVNWTVAQLADMLDLPEANIAATIAGNRPVTTTLAAQLEKVFGVDKQFWINRQQLFNEKMVAAAAACVDNPFKKKQ